MAEEHEKEMPFEDEGAGRIREEDDSTAEIKDGAGADSKTKAVDDSDSSGPTSECEPTATNEGDEGTSTW